MRDHVTTNSDGTINPYETPVGQLDVSRQTVPGRVYRRRHGWLIGFYALGAVLYLTLTVFLLRHAGIDRQGGILFSFNSPVVLAAVLLLFFSATWGWRCAVLAAFGQMLITIYMITHGMGNPEIVLMINGVITGIILVLALLAGVLAYLQSSPKNKGLVPVGVAEV